MLAAEASLGCGNPVSLATLSSGGTALDFGSGGSIDVLLSARRVAPGGKAYGLDMTDEMLKLAWRNRAEAGVENAEFLKGQIENLPLPEEHVDVIISNCVINLSTEKPRVIGEALRVLKPGGRFAGSDVVFLGEKSRLPEEVVRSVELWTGCVSGRWRRASMRRCSRRRGSRRSPWGLPTRTPPNGWRTWPKRGRRPCAPSRSRALSSGHANRWVGSGGVQKSGYGRVERPPVVRRTGVIGGR